MRIGLVCPYDLSRPGGVQQIVVELARHLQDRGDEVVVVSPGEPRSDPGVPFESVGGSVGFAANESKAPIALNPAAWTKTLRAIGQVDVIHIHEPFIPLVGWAALSLRSYPTVATFHADPPRWARNLYTVLAFAGELVLGKVTTTAASPVAAKAVPRKWEKPRVVPNAIDVPTYQIKADRQPLRVAFLGRDDPRKGLSVLLAAWPTIRKRHPDAELEVMGARRSMSLPGVTFHGPTDEETKREVLASSQVFVAPNLGGESFGIVVAEAMAAGCAVVASDIDAFRFVVGDVGVLTTPGDAHTLADTVTALLDDPGGARSLGDRGTEAVKRFDWPVVVEDYRESYRDALGRRSGTIRS